MLLARFEDSRCPSSRHGPCTLPSEDLCESLSLSMMIGNGYVHEIRKG